MSKIAILADTPTGITGYARVIREIANEFYKFGHEVKVVGRGYDGSKHDFPYEIIGPIDKTDNLCARAVKLLLAEWSPDILFTLGDIWMFDFIVSFPERKNVTWVAYFPLDGQPIPKKWIPIIHSIDHIITFSNYAERLIKNITAKKVDMIYHGVDTKVFKPLENRLSLKHQAGFIDKFVIGIVARNQPRKNISSLVRAFDEFSKDKKDVALYMHTAIQDIGWDMKELLSRYDILNKVYMTEGLTPSRGVSDQVLNQIYNLFDIHVLPTMGEGFGLPILEAQSAGIPSIVTNYSSCPELIIDKDLQLIKVLDFVNLNFNCIDQALVDHYDLVSKLEYFYNDWKNGKHKISELGLKGRELAITMDWKNFTKQFVNYIHNIESKNEKTKLSINSKFMKV